MAIEQRYPFLDRLIHRVAFAGAAVQLTAADVEAVLYGARFRSVAVNRPVFITSLPRAGTTLLLEQLNVLPEVATHTYRDMPFVLAPLLWEGLSRAFRKPSTLVERAHGDGMMVGYDSPEAFEEVLWKAHWPSRFAGDRIELWKDDEPAGDFREAFVSHMQRIIGARSGPDAERRRYVSKNNANIARIGFLKRLFPDSVVLVPFREPLDQAASLLRQHRRFLTRHREDPFGRRYMEDIGHLEFGALHRPIAFEGMDALRAKHRPESLDYWIGYWLNGFRHVLRQRERVVLVSYERLCAGGAEALRTVVNALDLNAPESALARAATFHEPRSYAPDVSHVSDRDLFDAAQQVQTTMLAHGII
jgi:hypothetical protein